MKIGNPGEARLRHGDAALLNRISKRPKRLMVSANADFI